MPSPKLIYSSIYTNHSTFKAMRAGTVIWNSGDALHRNNPSSLVLYCRSSIFLYAFFLQT